MVTISMAGATAVAVALTMPAAEAAFVYVPPDGPAQSAIEYDATEIRAPVSEGVQGKEGGREIPGAAREGGAPLETVSDPGVGAGEDHAPTTAEAEGGAPDPGLWHVRPGETLREVLGRWGARAGMEVLFLTDRRYRLHEGRTFAGPLAEAADGLFATLSHLPHPPVGERRSDGRTLAVLHRSRPAGDGQ